MKDLGNSSRIVIDYLGDSEGKVGRKYRIKKASKNVIEIHANIILIYIYSARERARAIVC